MLVTTINPKLFGGDLYFNSTLAIRFYFDQTIEEINQFTKKMRIEATKPFAKADTSDGMQKKKKKLSIVELHKFISNSKEQIQEADFLCSAKVIDVLCKNGWSYVSCVVCSRKLDKYGSTLCCNRCSTTNVTGAIRYRVELSVHDSQDGATFVVFDSEMTKLTNKTVYALILEDANGGDVDEIPNCIHEIVGKQFLFQIRVTLFNFISKHRTFTVSKITHDNPEFIKAVQVEKLTNGPTFNTTIDEGASSNHRLHCKCCRKDKKL